MADLTDFLAGDLPDHVALFLAESFVDHADALAEHGERVPGGVVLVVEGDRGRRVLRSTTGLDAMALAGEAGGHPATVAADLSGGDCPNAAGGPARSAGDPARPGDGPQGHAVRFVFAFAEAQTEDVGGLYAEGDVIHAYAACECGQAYSDRWVAGER